MERSKMGKRRRIALNMQANTDKLRAERDEAQAEVKRLLRVMAAALERTQVADDPSGAAEEATAILEAEVNLDGSPADASTG